MSIWDKIKGELVDIVEWTDDSRDTMVYRFQRYQNEIKYGAKLIVREGQAAVFVNEGKLADVFAPGTYTLETRNLPVLSTLQGWQYGFTSPFKAEVYFLSTRPVLNLQWGTQQAITMELPGFGLGQIRAFGQVSYRIADAQVFFRQIVGTSAVLVDNDLRDYLRGIIVARFAQALTEAHPTLEQLQANLASMSDTLLANINTLLAPLGFELIQFLVESLSLPPQLQAQLFSYSRLNNIDLGKLTQFNVANSIATIASNSGGSGGGGGGIGNLGGQFAQLGVGLAAAGQISRAVEGAMSGLGNTQNVAAQPTVTPPSLGVTAPPALYHVALDGQAQGPFTRDQLAVLVASSKMTPATLVWHPGMAAWSTAGTESALSALFPQQPPPLP